MSTALSLLRPLGRTIRWYPVSACWALALVTLLVPLLIERLPAGPALWLLRCAVLTAALALCLAQDDAAARSTEAVPVPLVVRLLVRLGLVWPGTLAVVLLLVGSFGAQLVEATVTWADLMVETIGLLLLATAAGLAGQRRVSSEPGSVLAAPLLLGVVLLAAVLPEPFGLFPTPGAPGWQQAHTGWAWLAPLTLFLCGWLVRDRVARLPRCSRPWAGSAPP